jgi:hypothetical protein
MFRNPCHPPRRAEPRLSESPHPENPAISSAAAIRTDTAKSATGKNLLLLAAVAVAPIVLLANSCSGPPGNGDQTDPIGGIVDHEISPDGKRLDLNFFTYPQDPTLKTPSLLLDVQFDNNRLDIFTPRCLVEGSGSYTMDAEGGWHFDPQDLASARCSTPETSYGFAETIKQLASAASWEHVHNDPRIPGDFFRFSSSVGSLLLFPDGEHIEFSVPRASSHSTEQRLDQLFGTWKVSAISGFGADLGDRLPFDWDLQITDSHVILPEGCNTPHSDGYVADADGRWAFGSDVRHTELFCVADGTPGESEFVFNLLRNVRTWTITDDDQLVLDADLQSLQLVRVGGL